MSVKKVTLIKNRNYYFSTFNPIKIFGTEIAAKQFEDQFALETMNYFTFYDKHGNSMEHRWEYHYDTDSEWRMEDRKLIEIVTHTPRFYWYDNPAEYGDISKRREVNFFYIYDRAFYLEIHTNPKQKEEYQKKIRSMNKAIQILNKKWKIDIPKQKGKYKFTKRNKWEKYYGSLPII